MNDNVEEKKEETANFRRIYRGRGIRKIESSFFIGLEKLKNNSKEDYFSWADFSELTGISKSTLKTIVKEYYSEPEVFKNRLKN